MTRPRSVPGPWVLALFLFTFLALPTSGDYPVSTSPLRPPEGWVEISAPRSQQEWGCANTHANAWDVAYGTDGLLIVPQARASDTIVHSVDGGHLRGWNRGEFGGRVQYIDLDGGRHAILEGNPVAFVQLDARLFVAEGLAHGVSDRGRLVELLRGARREWTLGAIVDLGAAPRTVLVEDDGSVLLVTSNSLFRIGPRRPELQVLYSNPGWREIYPTSIARSGDDLLIGARRAVIRLARIEEKWSESWWVPGECAILVGEHIPCSCKEAEASSLDGDE